MTSTAVQYDRRALDGIGNPLKPKRPEFVDLPRAGVPLVAIGPRPESVSSSSSISLSSPKPTR